MIGLYQYNQISVKYGYSHQNIFHWWAKILFLDDGWYDNNSTEGEIYTRYGMPNLYDAVKLIMNDAEKLGIVRQNLCWLWYAEDEKRLQLFPTPKDFKTTCQIVAWALNLSTYK